MTTAQIAAILPSKGRVLISDEMVRNLFLRVEPGGTKTWFYNAAPIRGQGRRIIENLGKWPLVHLAEAREAARALNLTKSAGIDPRVAKAEAEARDAEARANTVDVVFDRWLQYKLKTGRLSRALTAYQQVYRHNVQPTYGGVPIREFDKSAVRKCLRAMQDRGSIGAADRLILVLSAFLRWCIDEDYIKAHGALNFKTVKRSRSAGARMLSIEELALCWRASQSLSDNKRDAIRLLILTGLRRSEVCYAHASEYDRGVWTLPPARMRAGREHAVLVPSWGREILDRLTKERSGYLFNDKVYRMMLPRMAEKAHDAMERLSGTTIPCWSLNSIRKGVRSALNSDEMDASGHVFSEDIAEIVLAHSLGSLNRRYNKSKYARQIGRALEAWQHILKQEIDRQERLAHVLPKPKGEPQRLIPQRRGSHKHERERGEAEARPVSMDESLYDAGERLPSVHDKSPGVA